MVYSRPDTVRYSSVQWLETKWPRANTRTCDPHTVTSVWHQKTPKTHTNHKLNFKNNCLSTPPSHIVDFVFSFSLSFCFLTFCVVAFSLFCSFFFPFHKFGERIVENPASFIKVRTLSSAFNSQYSRLPPVNMWAQSNRDIGHDEAGNHTAEVQSERDAGFKQKHRASQVESRAHPGQNKNEL